MNLIHPHIDDVRLEDILYALSDSVRLQLAKALYIAKKPLTCTETAKNIANLPIPLVLTPSKSYAKRVLYIRKSKVGNALTPCVSTNLNNASQKYFQQFYGVEQS